MSPKILVIEDDDNIRTGLLDLLEVEEYTVCGGENGLVGLRLVNEFNPDLILCDITMPELDGYGVCERLQADPITAAIPFIFLTAHADRAAQRCGLNLGAADYLTKPFNCEDLLQAIERQLVKRRPPVKRSGEKRPTPVLPYEPRLRLSGMKPSTWASSDSAAFRFPAKSNTRVEQWQGIPCQ